jgi:rubrerythrin
MINAKQFVEDIAIRCEPLYQLHEQNVKKYFESQPSKQDMVEYFGRRMINERINCIELSRRVGSLPKNTSAEDMFLLSKQALDEAKHFWYVKDIVEDMLGHEVDVAETHEKIKQQQLSGDARALPAELLEKFECSQDPLNLAVYQYIAEGMAHRNWVMQAECAPNELIREKYTEIAQDEKFHASLGRRALEKLVVDEDTQTRATEIANEVVAILWQLGCIKQHIPLSTIDD